MAQQEARTPMSARAIWKGVLNVGADERVPVKLYSAVQDAKVHFRLLNAATERPVKQRMVSSASGDHVPKERVRRGLPTEDGRFIVLSEEELETLEPPPSRDIEVTRFVAPDALDPAWYDRPYYLGPDGDEDGYAALVDALRAHGTLGIARWVMRKKEYVGALRLEGAHLLLVTLHHTGEVVPASALPVPRGREPEPQEMRMAEQLLDALAGEWSPADYQDEYRARVLDLVRAKAEGRAIELPAFDRRPAGDDTDLAAVLEQSLAAARKKAA